MRVYDRYLGHEVDLPRSIVSGRYRLLRDAGLNEDIQLAAGQLVFSDGREHCRIGGIDGRFQEGGETETQIAKRDLIVPAMTTLARLIREHGEDQISPLMPAKNGELAGLGDLEKSLDQAMKHLREIDRRPRFSMHYEVDVAPISRAKRIAPTAITHLASHSEDWHRRTLSAVKPKRILALFSEDEWAIYENRVFARLLDRLDVYLKRRLADLTELESTYRNALDLGESTHLYSRLRHSLYKLWGDTLSVEETDRLLHTASNSLQTVRDLTKKISVLRQGELYGHVPRNAHVPQQLRDTNILQHDQHYRHLRALWLLHQKRSAETRATPAEMYDRNRQLFEDHVVYLGMLARRVLGDFKLLQQQGALSSGKFRFAGLSGQLRRVGDEWVLEYGETSLTIVPALVPVAEELPRGDTGARRVPVFLFPPPLKEGAETADKSGSIVVNPLEFYGQERMRVLIETFLWRPLLAGYGVPFHKLPSAAMKWLTSIGAGEADGTKLTMTEPLSEGKLQELEDWLTTAPVNEATKSSIRFRAKALQTLSCCRVCGKRGRFKAQGGGFKAECDGCSLEWGVFQQNGSRHAKFTVSGVSHPTFETHGSWNLEMRL